MSLETQGVPTAILCTEEFQALAHLRLEAVGLPAARIATIRHPLAGLAPEVVRARAADALSRIAQAFTLSA